MTVHNEHFHPRDRAGRWIDKPGSGPAAEGDPGDLTQATFNPPPTTAGGMVQDRFASEMSLLGRADYISGARYKEFEVAQKAYYTVGHTKNRVDALNRFLAADDQNPEVVAVRSSRVIDNYGRSDSILRFETLNDKGEPIGVIEGCITIPNGDDETMQLPATLSPSAHPRNLRLSSGMPIADIREWAGQEAAAYDESHPHDQTGTRMETSGFVSGTEGDPRDLTMPTTFSPPPTAPSGTVQDRFASEGSLTDRLAHIGKALDAVSQEVTRELRRTRDGWECASMAENFLRMADRNPEIVAVRYSRFSGSMESGFRLAGLEAVDRKGRRVRSGWDPISSRNFYDSGVVEGLFERPGWRSPHGVQIAKLREWVDNGGTLDPRG